MNRSTALSHIRIRCRAAIIGTVVCTAVLSSQPCSGETGGAASARPVVAVAKVLRGELSQQASFGAELRPYEEVELHARITGFLETLKVDAGDIVKENQLIATLDVPELKSEIDHALAAERRSKAEIDNANAAYENAHLALTRLTNVDKAQPNLIAQQDIDAALAKDRVAAAALEAAKEQGNVAAADVKKIHIMEGYAQITAPFGGAITKRYSDQGALIQAGTSTGSMPLVRLSQIDKLRAVFPVSVAYVSRIKVGDPVQIRIDSMDNRTIPGTVARFSRKVETSTRTMDVEVDVPDPDLSITPGIYATALLKVDVKKEALSVPIEAIARNKSGPTVFFVNIDRVEERKVTLGIETPDSVEVLTGAKEGELVVVGGRSEIKDGEVVEPILPSAAERPPAGGTGMQTAKSN